MYSLSVTQYYDTLTDLDVKCHRRSEKKRKESQQIGPEGKHVYRFISNWILFLKKRNGSRSLRPKTISVPDSLVQNDFLQGLIELT